MGSARRIPRATSPTSTPSRGGALPPRIGAFLAGALALDLLRHRDERPREAALPHDRAERVRDPERRVERVRERRGAEEAGDRRVAQDARQPGEHRPRGDAPGRSNEVPRVAQAEGIVGSDLNRRSHGWFYQQSHPHRPPRGRSRDARDDERRADRAPQGRDDRDVEQARTSGQEEAGEDRMAHGHRLQQAREHLRALSVEGPARVHGGVPPDAHLGRPRSPARSATRPRSRPAT